MRGAASATSNFGLPGELAELADGYEFSGELGRGGSAIVYRARDRSLGRDVAIKVVHPRATSPDDDAVARLAREARTVAQLQHPGIVTVYAVHRLQGGGLALVMQLVPGATLKQAIQRGGPFGAQRAEQILRDVADALAYAHARQIIHRDVKPENIFVDAESGRALLADFGIARSDETDSMTMTGAAIGTPFYMSPEQVDGLPVDGRSDLYSLGLVAWEMLTGRRPWDGESLYHVIYKQKHDVLPPIEVFRRDVPRRLQYIVERMLQKHPAARWAGADGLLAQLDRTILPADYSHWQAALPMRVARHRADATARSDASSKRVAREAVAGAATVQFTSADALARRPLGIPPGDATTTNQLVADRSESAPTATASGPKHPTLDGITAVRTPTQAIENIGPALASAPVAQAVRHAPALTRAYETVTPNWATGAVGEATSRPWSRRAVGGVAATGLVALAATAAVNFPDVAPVSGKGVVNAGLARVAEIIPSAMAPARWASRAPSTQQRSVPALLNDLTPRDLVAVGGRHACEITRAGRAQCWGDNSFAQLGDGGREARSERARPVAGVMTYVALTAGPTHSCGVTSSGDVFCWGANQLGQLGDGTTIERSAPVRIGGTGTYRMARAGSAHSCALDVDGTVRCWGDDSLGQIGDGSHGARFVPIAAHLPAGAAAIAIAVGGQHSCALLRDQRVMCWGSNIDGQLGISGVAASAEPQEVPGVRATAIGAGQAHTCAVLTTGPVRCWGRDDAGQLGVGAIDAHAPGRTTLIPVRDPVRAVVGGASHSCALTRGGSIWCWGRAASSPRGTPAVFGHGPYVAIAAGVNVSCGASRVRAAECWGSSASAAPDTSAVVRLRPIIPPRRIVRRHVAPRRHG